METDRLKQFCLIVETGSLTSAARLLHVTHSSLSKSMKTLQEQSRQMLFQPEGRGLALTEQGKRFYEAAKEFITIEARLFSETRTPTVVSLRLAAPEIFLSGLAEAFTSESPFGARTATLLDLDPGAMEQQIVARQLDFGVTYSPFPSDGVEVTEIGAFRLGCYHRVDTFAKTPLEELPFVVPALGLSTNPLGLKERDGWLTSLQPRKEMFAVNLLSTALELTLNGTCAIYMPSFVAHRLNARNGVDRQLVEFSLPKDLRRQEQTAYAIRARGRPEDRDFKKFCAAIRKIIRD